MKKGIFLLFFCFSLFFSTAALACDPSDPGCQEYGSSVDITGDQNQWQGSWFNDTLPDYGVAGGGTWTQEQCGWGEAQPGAQGMLEMNEAQAQSYNFSDSQDDGTEVTMSGAGGQSAHIWGTVNNNCDLDISSFNNMAGESFVSHGDNSMFGAQNANVEAGIDIDAAQGGGDLSGSQFHSYYQEMENGNWQGGSIHTEHCLGVGGDPQSPCGQ